MKKHVAIILALLTLGACGGGDYSPVNETHTGDIADGDTEHGGRVCDAYEVQLGRGWHINTAMTSEFDNYLYLTKIDDVATNDDSDGLNARIDTDVEMAGGYTVYACAYGTDRGSYTLTIETRPGQ